MATAPSPNDLTRQQLDELDALLQRMLSVPLSPADTPMPVGAPAPLPGPPPNWRVDPPAPIPAPAPHLTFPAPPSSVSLHQEAVPPAAVPTPPPPAPAPVKAVPKPAAKAPEPVFPPPVQPAAPPPVAVPPRAAPAPAALPVPLLFLPFVALNAVFDFVCGLFGPPGRLVRSGFFKQLYGLAGLALLAYTAAHVAQVKGWLTLPVQLPWPPAR